jgi:hypothetical protein
MSAARGVSAALEALGIVPAGPPAPAPVDDLATLRQAVRHLLQDLTGSSTGKRAVDRIEEVVGRRTLVVHLSAAELGELQRALEQEKAAAGG